MKPSSNPLAGKIAAASALAIATAVTGALIWATVNLPTTPHLRLNHAIAIHQPGSPSLTAAFAACTAIPRT